MFTFLDWSIFSQVNPMVSLPGLTRSRACPTSALNCRNRKHPISMQSSIHGRRLLDRPVKPGDDNTVDLIDLRGRVDGRLGFTISAAEPRATAVPPFRPQRGFAAFAVRRIGRDRDRHYRRLWRSGAI